MRVSGFATVGIAVSALTECVAFTCLRKESFNRAESCSLVARAFAISPPTASHEPSDQAAAGEGGVAGDSLSPSAVLVVEDDAGLQGILAQRLTDAGHRVRLRSSFGGGPGRLRLERYDLWSLPDPACAGRWSAMPPIRLHAEHPRAGFGLQHSSDGVDNDA